MAQQKRYYTAEEAAQVLGITPGEVNQRRERNELRGLKDGATWKFKVEDIEALAHRLKAGAAPPTDEGDVLASEVELGPSSSGKSGTVLGPGKAHDSDIQLAGSDVKLAGSDIKLAGSDIKVGSDVKRKSDVKLAEETIPPLPSPGEEELDLRLESEPTPVAQAAAEPAAPAAKKAGGSEIELAGSGLDDDDVVLGGSSSGSNVSIAGDSGISLVSPADSGLSLEEPVELPPSEDDSLELGEDDMLTFADAADTESPTELKSDDEFLLTPLEEAAEGEESESASQVIALDAGPVSDTAATMVGTGRPGGAAAMLDEELGGVGVLPAAPVAPAAPVGAAPAAGLFEPGAAAAAAPLPAGAPAAIALPETPYTPWNIAALGTCVVLLILCGWVAFDLVMNMWSWNAPYRLNSALMDWILSLF